MGTEVHPTSDAGRPATRWFRVEPLAIGPGPAMPGLELLLVLGVSLGRSAIYSVLSILDKVTREVPLNQQTTTINNSITPDRPWLDLAYQVANTLLPLVPAALALYLLRLAGDRPIGFDLRRPGFDASRGTLAALIVAVPGLALYFGSRALGVNTNVAPANLAENWWTVPVLVGLAAMNAILEEVIMLGYFLTRAAQLRWTPWLALLASALVRGSYHLYQGFGGFVANVLMGLLFGWLYLRWKRVGPLVVAHFLLDLVIFVGWGLVAPYTDLF